MPPQPGPQGGRAQRRRWGAALGKRTWTLRGRSSGPQRRLPRVCGWGLWGRRWGEGGWARTVPVARRQVCAVLFFNTHSVSVCGLPSVATAGTNARVCRTSASPPHAHPQRRGAQRINHQPSVAGGTPWYGWRPGVTTRGRSPQQGATCRRRLQPKSQQAPRGGLSNRLSAWGPETAEAGPRAECICMGKAAAGRSRGAF